ncbi:TPR repeat region-containing protein [Rhodococcus sp. SJ-2]
MIPSVSDVRQWNWSALSEQVISTESVATRLEDARDSIHTSTNDLWSAWTGTAADAAADHLDCERKSDTTIAYELREIAAATRRADEDLAHAARVALDRIAAAERAGFTVSDGGVAAGPDFTGVYDGEPDAAAHWSMIQDALRVIGELDDDPARRIGGIVSNLIDVTPPPATFSPDEATHDWAMLNDGTVTSEDLARFTTNLAAAGLDPHSLDELSAGKVVTALPAGAFDYLENLYGEAGAAGVMELQQQLLADGSASALDARDSLASGILALSNEHVRDVNDERGGWDRLPQDVRDLVETRPGAVQLDGYQVPPTLSAFMDTLPPDIRNELESEPGAAAAAHRNALANPGDAAYIDSVIRGREFWEFVGTGNGTPGAELGTKLVESAASQASVINATGSGTGPYDTIPITVGHAGESMLDVATSNHDVSARVLAGDMNGDGRSDIRRDDILTPLFTHDWDDDGESAGRLTNWMTHEMGEAHAAGDTARVDRAELAALHLSQYLSHEENFDRLMDVHGENTSSIGEVNPDLVRAFADGLHGYIPELVGADDTGVWRADSLEPVNSFGHAQRIFTLMATDSDSSTTFGSASTTFGRHFASEFIEGTSNSPAAYAGRLQALVDTGIYNAAGEKFNDRESIEEYAQQRRSDTYNTNYTIVRNLVALDPRLSGTVGLLMDINSSAMHGAFVPAFESTERSPFTGDFSQYGAANSYHLLEQAVAQHGMPQDPRILENLRAEGIIGIDGGLRYPPSSASLLDATDAIDQALDTYDIDYNKFRSYYIDGYGYIARPVRDSTYLESPR